MIVLTRKFMIIKDLGECFQKQLRLSCSIVDSVSPFKHSVQIRTLRVQAAVLSTNTLLSNVYDYSLPPGRTLVGSIDVKRLPKNQLTVEEIKRKYSDKVTALSQFLDCSQEAAAELFQKYSFLPKSRVSTINEKIKVLLDNGISKEELINDMWILTYNIPTLEERIELLKELNLEPIKPWLLRCSDHLLARMSRNRENNRLAMGDYKTISDYLKERLQMTEVQTSIFSSRHPAVMHVNVAKLKKMIDYLYSEGISPMQIYHTPRILCHSLITIQKRLKELKTYHYEPQNLSILCKSQRSFNKFVSNLDKDKIS